MRDLLVLSVVALIAKGGRGREHERAGDDGGEEGKAEEQEGMLDEGFAVSGGNGIGESGSEGAGGERRHCDIEAMCSCACCTYSVCGQ